MNKFSENKLSKLEGFTLVEIIVVVALIAILAVITFVAINPTQQFNDARDAQRQADINAILNATTQYLAQDGNTLATLEAAAGAIPLCSATPADIGTDTGDVDLESVLVETYIVAIPEDPSTATALDTGYNICETAGGRITVQATLADASTFSVSR